MSRWSVMLGAAVLALSPLGVGEAEAGRSRTSVGIYFGVPLGYYGYGPRYWYGAPYGYPPPYYGPPAGYYAPPPAYYEAPPLLAPPAAQACYAGPYMCQLDRPAAVGDSCSCPVTGGTRVFGRAGG